MSIPGVRWALQQEAPDRLKLVLAAIALAADEQDVTFTGQKGLAAAVGKSDRSVRTALGQLGREGLITRYRRHRINGSRTTDLIVLGRPRGEVLDLENYSGLIGEREPSDKVAPGAGLPTGSMVSGGPTGRQSSGAPGRQSSGPYPSLDPSTLQEYERGGGPGEDQQPLVPDERADRFKAWFLAEVAVRRGGVKPRVTASWDSAARRLLMIAPKGELRAAVVWALDRPYWVRQVNTSPRLAQRWPDLRAEWAAAARQDAERQARRPQNERPEVGKAVRVSYDSDRVEIG